MITEKEACRRLAINEEKFEQLGLRYLCEEVPAKKKFYISKTGAPPKRD